MAVAGYSSPVAICSSWTVRVAAFSGAVIGVAILLHRLLGMATPIALNLFGAALAGACLALLLGGISLIDVWRRGATGLVTTIAGMVIALGLLAWPASYLPAAMSLPELNDVTTDFAAPPSFVNLSVLRGPGTNGIVYNSERFPTLQKQAYPDIRTLPIPRSVTDAYEIAVDTVTRLKLDIVAEEPPDIAAHKPGRIEAVDRTLVIGFYDDVSIRVDGDASQARIDVRSASRYGRHDLGRNAQRVRRILNELQARYEATVPGGGQWMGRGRGRIVKAVPKRLKAAGQKPAARHK